MPPRSNEAKLKNKINGSQKCKHNCKWMFILYTVIFFISRVFIFGGRHISELPACEITNFAKQHFAARIVFVTNRLPVRVLDELITPICAIFRCASFWSGNYLDLTQSKSATNAKFIAFKFNILAGGICKMPCEIKNS